MVAQTTGVVSALESWRSYLLGPLHMSAVKRAGPVTRTNRNFSLVSETKKGQRSWGRVVVGTLRNKASMTKHKDYIF